jgi:hypothetical protein
MPRTALLIVGHSSTVNPDSSAFVAITISSRCFGKSDAEIERLVHQCDRFAFSKAAPPGGGNRPETKADVAHSEVSVFVSTIAHRVRK